MNQDQTTKNSKKSDKNQSIDNKIKYINVFSKFHTQYINLLNVLKKIISKLDTYNNISPQESLCLLQVYDYRSKNYTGDTGLKNLAKRTNNIADHLLFQLNNLARKNLVTISSTEIALTNDGEYIVNEIARQLKPSTMEILDENINNIQKYLAQII